MDSVPDLQSSLTSWPVKTSDSALHLDFDSTVDPEQKIIDEIYAALLPSIISTWEQGSGPNKAIGHPGLTTASSAISLNDPNPSYEVYIKFQNGNSYSGDVKNERLHGHGVYRWGDGSTYEGTFDENKLQGTGKIFYKSGQRYTGDVSYGYHHGNGLFVSDNVTFSGEFDSGMFHGKGYLQTSKGTFDGKFVDNKIFEGRRVYDDGTFNGRFNALGERSMGCFRLSNGDVYNGLWQQDYYCDFGIYKWSSYNKFDNSKNKFIMPKENYFVGYWADSYRFGPGVLHFDDRTIFCMWRFGLKVGAGVIIAANGDIFVGKNMFANAVYHEGFKVQSSKEADECIQTLKKLVKAKCPKDFALSNLESHVLSVEWFDHLAFENALTETVETLLQITEQIELPPLFLAKCMIDIKSTPILNFMADFFPDVEKETLEIIEIKSINQMITSNFKLLSEQYEKYALYGINSYSDRKIFMSRLGLWRFLKIVSFNHESFSISAFLEDTEYTFHMLSQDLNDPYEAIYFWQFLKYVLALTMCLNRNTTLANRAKDVRPTYFGLFGTMLILFLQECKEIESMPVDYLPKMLRSDPIVVDQALEYVTNFFPKFPLRKTYKIFKDLVMKTEPLSDGTHALTFDDFVECISKEFPSAVRDSSLNHVDIDLTVLEVFEVLFLLVSKTIRNEIYYAEKKKFEAKQHKKMQKFLEEAEKERAKKMLEIEEENIQKKKKTRK